ncbi:MAG: ATPase [Chlamydiae bacterium]|nr:ATPase [Chlamydiota bacterium]
MQNASFIGREAEMERLKGLLNKRSSSLIVVRGRRRIGKSRLLAEFGKEIKSLFFSGNPPVHGITAASQRELFADQLQRAGIPGIKSDNWGDLFWHLSKHTQKGRILIVLDEISWMGGKDPFFLGQLKTAWDMYFSKNPQLIMALCGSISSWIEKNILSHTGFVGRITIDFVLEELPLRACNAFWKPKEKHISAYEKFKLLSITGGVPLYLEQIEPSIPAEQNIRNLCFAKGGLLVREFDEVFSDLFSRTTTIHKKIVICLANGPKELVQICKDLEKSQGGLYSQYLDELVKAGFVKRDFIWDLKSGRQRKISRYRLSDNYLRFYLKYIAPNRIKIEKETMPTTIVSHFPGWDGIMGLQFENLVIHNFRTLWKELNLSGEEVVMDGPFFQTSTSKQQGCQIDYMIQTRFHNLYICEIKFSKDPIGIKIIQEVEEKIQRLKAPKRFSIRPILIHVNGVEDAVIDQEYFDKIIDFGQLLT